MDINDKDRNGNGSAKAQMKKRSSLKMTDSISKGQLEQLQQRCKRLSVNWDKSINFKCVKLKNIKTSFEEVSKGKEDEMKMKLFDEKRRNSIKNEFSLVKEYLKNEHIEEEDDDEDENALTIKENTRKNVEFGKQKEDLSDSCSSSDIEDDDDDDDANKSGEDNNNSNNI